MTLRELMDHILTACPQAIFDEGPTGEVIVFTGRAAPADADWESGDSTLTPLDEGV